MDSGFFLPSLQWQLPSDDKGTEINWIQRIYGIYARGPPFSYGIPSQQFQAYRFCVQHVTRLLTVVNYASHDFFAGSVVLAYILQWNMVVTLVVPPALLQGASSGAKSVSGQMLLLCVHLYRATYHHYGVLWILAK